MECPRYLADHDRRSFATSVVFVCGPQAEHDERVSRGPPLPGGGRIRPGEWSITLILEAQLNNVNDPVREGSNVVRDFQ